MNIAAKKQAYANDLVALADQLLLDAQRIDEMDQSYFANGFNTGANVFVDADFNAPSVNPQLSAAIVSGVITVIEAVRTALPQASRDNLRKALARGIP